MKINLHTTLDASFTTSFIMPKIHCPTLISLKKKLSPWSLLLRLILGHFCCVSSLVTFVFCCVSSLVTFFFFVNAHEHRSSFRILLDTRFFCQRTRAPELVPNFTGHSIIHSSVVDRSVLFLLKKSSLSLSYFHHTPRSVYAHFSKVRIETTRFMPIFF